MKRNIKRLFGVLLLSLCLVTSTYPAFAASKNIQVVFTDVTKTDPTTLEGEAKIMISVKGAEGNVSIAQIALEFTGKLNYKSITFLKGEDNPPECFLYSPNTAQVNAEKKLMPAIISSASIPFEEQTDLFILTFEGTGGQSVKLSVADKDSTYCSIVDENGSVDLKTKTEPS